MPFLQGIAQPEPPGDKRFYVVLSGLVPLVDMGDRMRAYMFRLEGHVHLAGQWLAELPVPPGLVAELIGVAPGTRRLTSADAKFTPTIRMDTVPDINTPEVHAYFDLPLPREIYFLNRGAIDVEDRQGKLIAPAETLSGARVLEYGMEENFNQVKLRTSEGAFWRNGNRSSTFGEFGEFGSVGSLHLIDGPHATQSLPNNHNDLEYRLNASLFSAPSLQFGRVSTTLITDGPRPKGLAEWELLPLGARGAISDFLADILRTGRVDPLSVISDAGCSPCCAPSNGKQGG